MLAQRTERHCEIIVYNKGSAGKEKIAFSQPLVESLVTFRDFAFSPEFDEDELIKISKIL